MHSSNHQEPDSHGNPVTGLAYAALFTGGFLTLASMLVHLF